MQIFEQFLQSIYVGRQAATGVHYQSTEVLGPITEVQLFWLQACFQQGEWPPILRIDNKASLMIRAEVSC